MQEITLDTLTDIPYSLYIHLPGAVLLKTCYKENKYPQNLELIGKEYCYKRGRRQLNGRCRDLDMIPIAREDIFERTVMEL